MRGLHISTIFQDNSTDFFYSVCRNVQTNFQGACNHLHEVCTFVHVFLKKSRYLECISAEGTSAEEISVEYISLENILDISVKDIYVDGFCGKISLALDYMYLGTPNVVLYTLITVF